MASEANIDKLPTDYRVIQLIDYVQGSNRFTVSLCAKHPLQPLNFFCETCIQPVCRDCTVLDHKQQDSHTVMDIDAALQKYSPILDDTSQRLDRDNAMLEEKRRTLQNNLLNLDGTQEELSTKIKETFGCLRRLLEEREMELLGISEDEIMKEQRKLKNKITLIKTRQKSVTEQRYALTKAQSELNLEDMFRVHLDIKGALSQADPTRDIEHEYSTTYSFNASNEKQLSITISNLGDIISQEESMQYHGY